MTKQERDEEKSDDTRDRIHRRGFFREGFRQLLKPIADAVEERVSQMDLPEWSSDETRAPSGRGLDQSELDEFVTDADGRTFLRPPGALPEGEFLSRCAASGGCVQSCPVSAIRLVRDEDPARNNRPVIDPESQACVVCEDLSCMKACPTGTLQLVPAEEIDMGLAVVDETLCVRSQGEDCQICVDKCPLGPAAIDIPDYGGEVEVKEPGCTGCGVCQMHCPTAPSAIVVQPRTD